MPEDQCLNSTIKPCEEGKWRMEPRWIRSHPSQTFGKPQGVLTSQHSTDTAGDFSNQGWRHLAEAGKIRKDGELWDVQLPNRCKQSKHQLKFEADGIFSLFDLKCVLGVGRTARKRCVARMCPDEFLHHGNPIRYGSRVVEKTLSSSYGALLNSHINISW